MHVYVYKRSSRDAPNFFSNVRLCGKRKVGQLLHSLGLATLSCHSRHRRKPLSLLLELMDAALEASVVLIGNSRTREGQTVGWTRVRNMYIHISHPNGLLQIPSVFSDVHRGTHRTHANFRRGQNHVWFGEKVHACTCAAGQRIRVVPKKWRVYVGSSVPAWLVVGNFLCLPARPHALPILNVCRCVIGMGATLRYAFAGYCVA